MIVAGLLGNFLREEPAGRLKIEHRDLRRQQRRLHPLPRTRFLALEQRNEDPHRAEDSCRHIRDRNTDTHRALTLQPRDRHQPAHPLRDLIESRPIGIRAGLAEARDTRIDEARIDHTQGLVIDPEPMLHVGAVVLDDHVGALDEALENLAPFRRFEIERQATLVAMQILEVEPVPRTDFGGGVVGRFDLEHVGAPIGELPHGRRTGARPRQIDHLETCQR